MNQKMSDRLIENGSDIAPLQAATDTWTDCLVQGSFLDFSSLMNLEHFHGKEEESRMSSLPKLHLLSCDWGEFSSLGNETISSTSSLSPLLPSPKFKIHRGFSIHPWLSTEDQLKRLGTLNTHIVDGTIGSFSFIGEVGLDKLAQSRDQFEGSLKILGEIVELSKSSRLPIIFHVVKAVDEFLKILDNKNFDGPFLVHGFRGSIETAERIINRNGYISVGEKSLQHHSRMVQSIPLHRLLLETDQPHMDFDMVKYSRLSLPQQKYDSTLIQSVYKKAAELMNVTNLELSYQLNKNRIAFLGEV